MSDWTSRFAALHEHALTSLHYSEKIAAQILYPSSQLEDPCFNARPQLVDALGLGPKIKIAERSLYVHAETRALLHARRSTRGATLLVTDPFCPNCAKQIAWAGIARVIIDPHGFDKPYHHKNSEAFTNLSHAILAWAGVAVFVARGKHLERQVPNAPAIESMRRLDDTARLQVSGSWCGQRWIKARGVCFEGPAFTPKYDARIEAPIVALMKAKRKGLLPKTLETIVLSHWPDTPRSFIDGLELGLSRYKIVERNAPVWAADLTSIGISVES